MAAKLLITAVALSLQLMDAMKRNYALFVGALACGLAVSPLPAHEDKGVKDDLKQAGKATGHAAKKTAKTVKKGTQKGLNKAAAATEKGAAKMKDKTDDKK